MLQMLRATLEHGMKIILEWKLSTLPISWLKKQPASPFSGATSPSPSTNVRQPIHRAASQH